MREILPYFFIHLGMGDKDNISLLTQSPDNPQADWLVQVYKYFCFGTILDFKNFQEEW